MRSSRRFAPQDDQRPLMMRKILIIFLAFIAALLVFFLLKVKNFYDTIYKGAPLKTNNIQQEKKRTIYNIALLGYGGGKHEGTYLTDSIMVIHLNTEKKQALLLSIPRDIWVKVPTKSEDQKKTKINSLYQMGLNPENYPDLPPKFSDKEHPAELLKDVLTQITGLSMDNFIAVDFTSFQKVIDGIGGVDVDVDKSFDDYEYPIEGKEKDLCGKEEQFKQIEKYMQVDKTATESAETKEMNEFLKDKPELSDLLTNITDAPFKAFPCRYEHLHFDKGKMHMDGETALKFVRSRHSLQDGTDFARGRRQQRLLLAVKEKVLSIAFLPKIIPLMESLQDDIQMDLSVTDIKNLLAESNNSKNYKIINLVLSDENYLQSSYSENGQSILIEKSGNNNTGQDWIDIRKWIQESLAGITPTPEITKSRVPIKER